MYIEIEVHALTPSLPPSSLPPPSLPPPPSPLPSLPDYTKVDLFNSPDSDDPVAQTMYKMIEPDDKVSNLLVIHCILLVI